MSNESRKKRRAATSRAPRAAPMPSGRKRVEEALRLSEETLELAIRSARLGVWDWDVHNDVMVWNDRMLELYGITREQFSGDVRAWENGLHPEDRARALAECAAALRGERPWDTQFRVQNPDGTVRYIKASGVVLRDEDGVPQRMLGLNQDVTEPTRATALALEREARYRQLFENPLTGIAVHEIVRDEKGKAVDYTFLAVNAAFEHQTGLRAQEILGRRVTQVLPGIETGPFLDVYGEVVRTGKPALLEQYAAPLDRHYLINAFRTAPQRFATVFVDITERKRAEEALKKARSILAEGQRIAHVGSFEYVVDGGTTVWSEEEYRIYGLEPSGPSPSYEVLLARCIHPDDAALLRETFSAALKNRTTFELRHRIVRPEGTVRWVDNRAVPYFDENGKLVRYIGVTVDITDARRAEEALREAERRKAEEAAWRETDRRRNEFLAMLAHELRNPLAPIRNSLYILDRVPREGEQARRAQAIIERQVGHLTRLVDDLLDVSRITRGKVALQRERLDLCELVHRTVEDHRGAFVTGEVALEVATVPGQVWVNGDRTRLAQVVGNLLQNSAKFTPGGGKTVVAVEADAARGHATVRVRDTGRGIAPEVLPHLFEAFTQADASLDRQKGGLGLGLALVKGLVEMHQGSVTAASDGPGKGATFTVTLPLEGSASAAKELGAAEARAPSRRVLVIEDNRDAAISLREALELEGHHVEVTFAAREGITKARSFHPDVVLCDVGLPEMNGYEVARAMRADPQLAGIRLVAVTGYASPEDVARSREAGFDAHLAKPPSMESLVKVLRNGKPPARSESETPGSP